MKRNFNHIVVLTSSAGGVKALTEILSNLPPDFPAPIAIVQHLAPFHRSWLAEILNRATPLFVKQAQADDLLTVGTIYIAAPNFHLLVNEDGTLALTSTQRVRNARPSGDVLFKSVAENFCEQAIAVVLTGMDGDGADGVKAIKQMGGKVIAQDEITSEYFSMPESAIKTGDVDFILPLSAIAQTLVTLVQL